MAISSTGVLFFVQAWPRGGQIAVGSCWACSHFFERERCGHEWIPRHKDQEPRVCPRCKTPYWNRPRKAAKKD